MVQRLLQRTARGAVVGRVPARADVQEVGKRRQERRSRPGPHDGSRHGELGQLRRHRLLIRLRQHRGNRHRTRLQSESAAAGEQVADRDLDHENKNEVRGSSPSSIRGDEEGAGRGPRSGRAAARRASSPTNGPTIIQRAGGMPNVAVLTGLQAARLLSICRAWIFRPACPRAVGNHFGDEGQRAGRQCGHPSASTTPRQARASRRFLQGEQQGLPEQRPASRSWSSSKVGGQGGVPRPAAPL